LRPSEYRVIRHAALNDAHTNASPPLESMRYVGYNRSMITTIRRSGNSFIIRVPREEMKRVGVKPDEHVLVEIRPLDIRPKLTPRLQTVADEILLRLGGQELLESAVHRAQTAAFYGDAGVALQAAAMANGILLNHPFLDGNKRSAWLACVAFLWLNGYRLPDKALDALADQLIAQLAGTDRSKSDVLLADWLRAQLLS
jgi:death-on-curing protein